MAVVSLNNKPVEHDTFVKVRVSTELKTQFQSICKSKAVNASELLRQYIEQYVEENTLKK